MKKSLRYAIPAMMACILLLAGCSLTPPNIPRTGGTPVVSPTTGTLAAVSPTAGTPTTGQGNIGPTAAPAATDTPNANPAPTNTSAPAATNTTAPAAPTATSAPAAATATSGPVVSSIPLPGQRQTIQFRANATSFVVTANLAQGAAQAYQLQAGAGQRMYVTIDGNAVMQVYGPNQGALTGVVAAINPVSVPLSSAGTYYIALQGSGPVVMSIYIPSAGSNQNVPAPVPAALTPIRFQTGATSASFSANSAAGTPLGYTIDVQAGQKMTVVTSGNATVTLLAPDRATMVPSAAMPTHQWLFPLNQNGTYTLILLGNGPVSVTVSIPAVSGPGNVPPTPIPAPGNPTRVTFGAGNASTTINANLVAGQPQAYVLSVQQGQTLYVSTTGSVDVTIYGPGNSVLVNGHASFPNRWSTPANQTGDYTFVVSGSGPCQLVFYVPPR